MARVTIEDCMEVIDNRFALCVVAMKRAKQIVKGKVERLEKERKLAEAAAESEEIPSPEVMEMNIDRSYKDHEEETPIIASIREIADGTVKSTYEELKGS